MNGIRDVKTLLKTMKPELQDGEWVFCTKAEQELNSLKLKPLLIFQEKEGTTVIVAKQEAFKHALPFQGIWALITLTVHSDLFAIGFLEAILQKLAAAGISVNVVSAFYHDHLFVPWEKREEAMKILEKFQVKRPK